MSKLTTEITIEELQYRINAHENDLTQMWTADYFLSVQKELLALKQAAKNPIGSFHISGGQVEATTDYCRDGEWPVQDGEVLVYAAPVLPKQPVVLYMGRELISKEGLELIRDGVSEATQLESMCMASAILGGGYPAQPVSEPFKSPDGKDSAISEAVAAIYLNDSTDYLPALFSVVNALSPEIFSLLLSNEKAAFDATRLPAAPAQESE